MERDRWTRAAIILVAISAVIFLSEKAWQLSGFFGDIILVFALAWLIAFVLDPLVDRLSGRPAPHILTKLVRQRWGNRVANVLENLRLPRGLAVSLVYLGLVVVMVVIGIFLVPVTVTQLSQLGAKLPEYIAQAPNWLETLQEKLTRLNIYVDLTSIYRPEEMSRRAEIIGAAIVQNALVVVTQVVSGVANVFIIIILSFYMMLDGKRVARQALALIPAEYHDELSVAGESIERTFGGFIRGQLAMALLYAAFVTLAMTIAGLRFAVAIGSLAGLVMFIPVIGAPITMVMPAIITLFQNPSLALWMLLIMTVYQQILLHIVMPKVMSEAVGMPPLLILAAIMISARLIGLWGFIFGIPVAGALYATGTFFLDRWKEQQRESLGEIEPQEAVEENDKGN
ncbi:MAG: AI-2E family transporter [Anaerolineae bacterium]